MTAVVVVLALVVGVLGVLVGGLLRSHAVILRRLHELGAGVDDPGASGSVLATRGGAAADGRPRVAPGTVAPTASAPGRVVADIAGATPGGDAVAIRVVGVGHRTVVVFLSSTCATCARFWEAFRDPGTLRLPEGARFVICVRGVDHESPALVADLAPSGAVVVASDAAWTDYDVPGAPYVVYVDGTEGRVVGEGTGRTWGQVAAMLSQATGDLEFVAGRAGRRRSKPRADTDREADLDRALIDAGILPGDERLLRPLDVPEPEQT